MANTAFEPSEIEELERVAAWRLRRVDADPHDHASASAATRLERLAEDLRHNTYTDLMSELYFICNYLGESDMISDYAERAAAYRARIGFDEHPEDGAAYLHGLLAIARSLV
jgi:hypothetical protein